jgi:hypothetical protein
MQYTVARGAMKMIAQMGRVGQLETMGISEDDFERVTGKTPWLGTDRNRITQSLNAMLCGTLDALSIPRFEMPAEYVSAGIALFVDPINVHSACRFMENIPTAQALGRGADESEICTARQLFALVVQLVGDPERSVAKVLFERNTKISLDKENKRKKGEQDNGQRKLKP